MGLQSDLENARKEHGDVMAQQQPEAAQEHGIVSDAAEVVESGLEMLESAATTVGAALFPSAPAAPATVDCLPTVDLSLPTSVEAK